MLVPLDLKRNKHGTTTAGETAAIMDPSKRDQSHGRFKTKWDTTAANPASTIHGTKPSRSTLNFKRFKACGSRSNPARIRIIIKAIFLQVKPTLAATDSYNQFIQNLNNSYLY